MNLELFLSLLLLQREVVFCCNLAIITEKSILPIRPLYPKDTESKDSLVSCCCLRNSSTAMPCNDDG